MRKTRAIAIIEMEELDDDVKLTAAALSARWVYHHPPRIVFEPSAKEPPFLRTDSNIRTKTPTKRP
jgi:hypothetical protein